MNQQKISAAAQLLLEARCLNRPVARMPADLVPANRNEAYAVQRAVTASLGAPGGWKVGAKDWTAEPSCAPLPAALMHRAPHIAPLAGVAGIEVEIAVRLARDLPPLPEGRAYRVEEVHAALGSIHPAIEIVGSRFADPGSEDPLSTLADSLANLGFVYGAGVELQDLDQTRQEASLFFGEALVADTLGGNPAGDIWRLLAWLANHVASEEGGLRAGQMITTGSCTGLLMPEPGITVRALLDGLGEVELILT